MSGMTKDSCISTALYTSLFTKMLVKRRKRKKIHLYKNVQQTRTEAEIKNKHMHNIHKD